MVLAQRVNAFTTRTESVEEEEKKKIGVSSRVFWNSCTCNRSMWKLRHWLHSSLPDSFFLSFFFFPSLVLLSLSLPVPRRCVSLLLFSLSSHFSFPHYLVSALGNIVALCPRSSLFLPRLPLRPSTLNEGSFFTGTENSPTSKARAVLTFFRTYAFFLSLSLSLSSPQDFPFVSPSPLRLRFLPSETRSCFPCCAVLVAINS